MAVALDWMTVTGGIATLTDLVRGYQRRAEGGRGDVARMSGSASRARRRLSISGGVARHRGAEGTGFAILLLAESLRQRSHARKMYLWVGDIAL